MLASRSFCRFVGCTSMIGESPGSTTIPKMFCWNWDLVTVRRHLSKVNSLSCSRNQSEMIELCDMLHYPARKVAIRRWYTVSHKGDGIMVSNNTQVRLVRFKKRCSIGTKVPKFVKKISLTPLNHHHTTAWNHWDQGRIPCFHVLYNTNSDPNHLNVAAEIETHQTRQSFFQSSYSKLLNLCEL